MRYLTAHTSIPVPRVIHYCIDADSGGVGSPYMILAKVDGVPLSSVWDDMGDAKREMVLREIVDILLELASHRFDKIGTIFQRQSDNTKEEWYVAPTVSSPRDTSASNSVSSRTFTSTVDYCSPMPTQTSRAFVIPILARILRYISMAMHGSCAPLSLHCTTPPSMPLVFPYVLEIFIPRIS